MAGNKVTLTFGGDSTSLDRATAAANRDLASVNSSLTANATHAQTASAGISDAGNKFKESSTKIRGLREVLDGGAKALTAFGGEIPGPVDELATMGMGLAHLAKGIGESVAPAVTALAAKFGLLTVAVEETTVAEDGSIVATGEMGAAQLTAAGSALKFAGAVGLIAGGLYLLKDKLEAAGTALGNWLEPLKNGTIDTTAADKANQDLADAFEKAGLGAMYAGAAQQAMYDATNVTSAGAEGLVASLEKLGYTNKEVITTLENLGVSASAAADAVNGANFASADGQLAALGDTALQAAGALAVAAAQGQAAWSALNGGQYGPITAKQGQDALAGKLDVSAETIKVPKIKTAGAAKAIKLTGSALIKAFIDGIQGSQPALTKALDSVSDGVKAKLQAMDALTTKAKQIAQSIATAFAPKVEQQGSVLDQLDYQMRQTQALQRDLALLSKEHLDKDLLASLTSGGLASLDAANQLAAGGLGAVSRANADAAGINKAGNQIGGLNAFAQTGVTLNTTNTVILKLDGQTLAKVVVDSLRKAIKADGGSVQKVLGSGY